MREDRAVAARCRVSLSYFLSLRYGVATCYRLRTVCERKRLGRGRFGSQLISLESADREALPSLFPRSTLTASAASSPSSPPSPRTTQLFQVERQRRRQEAVLPRGFRLLRGTLRGRRYPHRQGQRDEEGSEDEQGAVPGAEAQGRRDRQGERGRGRGRGRETSRERDDRGPVFSLVRRAAADASDVFFFVSLTFTPHLSLLFSLDR